MRICKRLETHTGSSMQNVQEALEMDDQPPASSKRGRLTKSLLWVSGLVVATVLTLVATDGWTALKAWVIQRREAPSCIDPQGLRQITKEAQVSASSARAPETAKDGRHLQYDANQVVDDDKGTGWAEGVEGWGIGQQLKFTWVSDVNPRLLCMVDGYPLTPDLYDRNGKPSRVTIATSAGSQASPLRVDADAYRLSQSVPVIPGPTRVLTITVDDVEEGQGRDRYMDTAIAEVLIWADG